MNRAASMLTVVTVLIISAIDLSSALAACGVDRIVAFCDRQFNVCQAGLTDCENKGTFFTSGINLCTGGCSSARDKCLLEQCRGYPQVDPRASGFDPQCPPGQIIGRTGKCITEPGGGPVKQPPVTDVCPIGVDLIRGQRCVCPYGSVIIDSITGALSCPKPDPVGGYLPPQSGRAIIVQPDVRPHADDLGRVRPRPPQPALFPGRPLRQPALLPGSPIRQPARRHGERVEPR
jgi:hypothetical protein